MVRDGLDVISFTVGEPDFDTPDTIKQAAHVAVEAGHTKYTPASGDPELKAAIARKLEKDNGLSCAPEQVLVSNGAKQALYMLMLVLLDRGDELLLPAPHWVSYPAQAAYCGARGVSIDCTGNETLKLTPELLEMAVTERSKVLLLNSPCNPTGAVLNGEELRELCELAAKHDLWIVSDEVYEKLIYDDAEHHSPAGSSDELSQRTITVNAVSKTYAMTGWRIGYAAGPKEVIQAASYLQSNTTSGPNSMAQRAAIEALTGPQDSVQEMRQAFDERRKLMVAMLNEIPGVSCPMPKGAFYAFPDVRGLLGRTYGGKIIHTSRELSEMLLQDAHVATVPGAAFAAEGYLRLSYATDTASIQEGLKRIARFAESGKG